ncbi:MAG: response regulator [Nitrospirales bacterium]|nr:response regulator [Nitrospirales bacterium]
MPHTTCVLLESVVEYSGSPLHVSASDVVLAKNCDPNELLVYCEKGRWERVLSRVEHLLKTRTSDLRESEAQFRGLFEILPDILVIYDFQGTIQCINAAGARQLQYSPDDLVGKPLAMLYPATESIEIRSSWPACFSPDGHWSEAILLGRDGSQVCTEKTVRPVRFGGKPHMLLIARDLSGRKQMEADKAKLEQQLRQVQKMEAIGRLASGVAHDMNNIMTAILSHASLLKSRSEPEDGAWTVGNVIEKAVRRGRELTSQLLGFARQGKHHHVPVDLHDVIREVVHLLERTMGKTIAFQMEFNAGQPWIEGDPNQMFQVFMNLSVNACDAMGTSGELRFATSNETVSDMQASHVPGLYPGDYVVVRVTDSGEGIPAEVQGKIFEPFFSTKESGKGSGMGLAMVYGIVKNHRGYIGVTSTFGAGTTMKVYLPASSQVPSKPLVSQKSAPSKGTGHILVVDDEREVAEATSAVLKYLGYQVAVVLNGKEAIEYCQDARNQVDIVVLDMVMPDMPGPECFAHLKQWIPDIKVILCTGYDRNHAVQELLNQGVVAFLQKPYEIDQIAKVCVELSQPTGQCPDHVSSLSS